MAKADSCRVRVWCEDRRQEVFVRNLLVERGFNRRKLDFRVAPRGQGAASAWVIARYGSEVIPLARTTKNQTNLGFLVVVDGDSQGLEARKGAMCGTPDQREPGDRIAICVPTWSVETWVLWLCGDGSVTEDRKYKSRYREDDREFQRRALEAVRAWEPTQSVRKRLSLR